MAQDLESLLDSIAIPAAQGRRAAAVQLTYERDLGQADLDFILSGAAQAAPVPAVKELATRHHEIARLLAEGKRPYEVCVRTGYKAARISVLQADPAFRELVTYYSDNKDAQFVDYHARLAALGTTAVEELQDRLESDPEKFTNRELKEIMESAYDRSVSPNKAGPVGAGAALTAIQVTFVKADHKARPGDGVVIDVEAQP